MADRERKGRKEPRIEAPERGLGRLDIALTDADRPSSLKGLPRRRPVQNAAPGRSEPALYGEDAEIAPARKAARARQSVADDEDEAPMPPKARRTEASPKKTGKAPPPKRGFLLRLIRGGIYWSLVASIWIGIGLAGVVLYYGSRLPPTAEWAVPKRPPNIRIVATDGTLLGNRGDTGGEAVRIEDLPPYLPAAIVATEDRRFYGHFGLDPIGFARAVSVNVLRRGVSQGGSTLTQQLAKNLFLTQERTLGRKVQEVLLALWLEKEYSKKAILEMYLNRVYMGAGAYGVDAAAHRYFGKSAKDVTLMEAAMLAGLLKAPSRYAPSKNPDLARDRATTVLALMVETGAIKPDQRDLALKAPRTIFQKPATGSESYVADWVTDILPNFVSAVDEDIIVETSIDSSMQLLGEAALQGGLETFGAKQDIDEGALVALDPTGGVKALVGGADYHRSQYNRAVTAKRQPGSSFKPFVYLAAIEAGLTPDTVRVDEPIQIKGWSPKNYSKEFKGPVTLRDALAQSINTVAVKLALEVGPKRVAAVAERLGIVSALQVNASLALGTSEVSPLEIANAYVPFANGGFGTVAHVIERIRTPNNRVLYQRRGTGIGRVIEPAHLAAMNSMMAETLATGTARKAQIAGWPAGGKTGTSQDFRDAWFIGYTGLLTTAVWLGNDDGSPTKHASGGTTAASIWNRFMTDAHRGKAMVEIPGSLRMPVGVDQMATGSVPQVQPMPTPQPQWAPATPPAPGQSRPRDPIAEQIGAAPRPPAPIAAPAPQPQPAPVAQQPDAIDGFLKKLFGG